MNLIDRYIIKTFISTLLFAMIALCVIFIIVNLLERLDDFLDQNAGFMVIAKYYIYYLPAILQILTPVATLLSTLFTIGRMSTINEITAMKSGGMSLYRIMLPVIFIAILLSFGQLYFNGWVVPVANKNKNEIEKKYLNVSSTGAPIYNLYFRDKPTTNVMMQYYDANSKTGSRVSIEEFSEEMKPRLVKRAEAGQIFWDTAKSVWIMKDAIIREYFANKVGIQRVGEYEVKLMISHDQISKLQQSPDEMTFTESRDYIEILKTGGKDVRMQLIDYHGKWAFPFANLIVILFGVPFASVRRKGGIAIQIGAAMVVSFTYMIFTKVSQTISFAYGFDPVFSGWVANIIFFIVGIITILRTKT